MLPALAPLVPTLIGTAATAVAGVGLTAAAPSIKATLFGKVSRRFNDEWDGLDPNTRIVETDGKGNETFKPLTTPILNDMGYNSWTHYEESLKAKASKKAKDRSLGRLEAGAARREASQDQLIKAQIRDLKDQNELRFATLEADKERAAATARAEKERIEFNDRQRVDTTNLSNRRLNIEEQGQATLAGQAERANERARVKDNNEAKLLNYKIGQDKADARYKDAMAVYEQEERRRSIPGALLSRIGLALLGEPNF